MRKRVYIDVDGVTNFDDHCEGSVDIQVTVKGETGLIRVNVNHGPWLLELAEETKSDLWWATSWQDLANEFIGSNIGLPELPVLELGMRKFSQNPGSWKSNGAIDQYEADGVKFLWFDDDFFIPKYLARIPKEDHVVRLIEGRSGISREDIDFAREWLLNV